MIAMRDAFLGEIHRRMADRSDLFFLSADLGSPQLDAIRADHGDRFINVGIAEQNLVSVSLGLALEGFTVFAYAIAPFISMRCYEQIRVDLALHAQLRPINVNLLSVGAGMSYDVSGPTHHCLEDLSIIRTLPHLELHSPSDAPSAVAMVDGALARAVPKYFRFDGKPLPDLAGAVPPEAVARGFRVLAAGRYLILATGYMTHKACRIARAFPPGTVGVVDLLSLRPLDAAALAQVMAGAQWLMTLEEGFAGAGGLDALAGSILREAGLCRPLDCQGVRGRYLFEAGGREALHQLAGLSDATLCGRIRAAMESP
jgi:transketolase